MLQVTLTVSESCWQQPQKSAAEADRAADEVNILGISGLDWSRIGVELAVLQVSESHEVLRDFLGLLPPRPSREEARVKSEGLQM